MAHRRAVFPNYPALLTMPALAPVRTGFHDRVLKSGSQHEQPEDTEAAYRILWLTCYYKGMSFLSFEDISSNNSKVDFRSDSEKSFVEVRRRNADGEASWFQAKHKGAIISAQKILALVKESARAGDYRGYYVHGFDPFILVSEVTSEKWQNYFTTKPWPLEGSKGKNSHAKRNDGQETSAQVSIGFDVDIRNGVEKFVHCTDVVTPWRGDNNCLFETWKENVKAVAPF